MVSFAGSCLDGVGFRFYRLVVVSNCGVVWDVVAKLARGSKLCVAEAETKPPMRAPALLTLADHCSCVTEIHINCT